MLCAPPHTHTKVILLFSCELGQVIKTNSKWERGEGEETIGFPHVFLGEVAHSINQQVFTNRRLCQGLIEATTEQTNKIPVFLEIKF